MQGGGYLAIGSVILFFGIIAAWLVERWMASRGDPEAEDELGEE